jgi:hypothetical protein
VHERVSTTELGTACGTKERNPASHGHARVFCHSLMIYLIQEKEGTWSQYALLFVSGMVAEMFC